MLRILVQGAVRARIQNMDGGENSLVGECKAYHKGGGYWLIVVNDQLTGNTPKALEMMKVRREQVSTPHGA